MKINFNRIEIHSFMSFEDQTFDFSLMEGMTLVQGKNNDIPNLKNGSGKSSLFMSLLYVLFGQLQNQIKKNENIVNRYAHDKDTRVVLSFDVDGQKYKIARGLNKGKTSYLNLYDSSGDEDKDITKSTIAETQSFIENEILHCDISIFMRTIMLSADQTYNFYTLKKADKKEFVEKLFDISVFGDMYQAIHKDKLSLDKSLLSQQNQLLILNKNVDDYTNLKMQHDAKTNQQIQNTTAAAKQLDAELRLLTEKTININQTTVQKLKTAASKLEQAQQNALQKQQQISEKKTKLQVALSKIQTEIDLKKKLIAKHSGIENKLCNECQTVFRKHYDLDEAQKTIDDLLEKTIKINAAIEQCIADETKQSSELKLIKEKIKLVNDKTTSLMSESVEHSAKVATTKSKLDHANLELKQLQTAVNPYTKMLEDANASVNDTNEKLKQNSTKHQYLEFAENIVSQDTLRKFIIKDLIVLLNNRIKTYLMRLGAKYYVEFDEDMDYDFIVPNGTCEFGNFSAGERMRLMIATSLAFRDFMSIRNGLNANVLILDEYFDSAIDSICIDSVLKILDEYKTKMKQNIFVISHRLEVNLDQFDRTIVVEKTNNLSKVVFM